ncbi:glycosyltransferase family A protein [Hoeflea sp. CAU 1731]
MYNLIQQSLPILNHSSIISSEGDLGGGWLISHAKKEQSTPSAKDAFILEFDISSALPTAKFSMNEEFRWFRIEYELPRKYIQEGKFVFCFSYRKLSEVNDSTTSIKIIEYIDGKGQTYANIFRDLSQSIEPRSISRQLEFFGSGTENASYRLCFEFKQPIDFWFGEVELVQVSPSKEVASKSRTTPFYFPPYRAFQYQVSEQLCRLNDQMDSLMRKSPSQWAEEILKVALTLEDYETATGLAEYLEHLYKKDGTFQSEAIGSLLKSKIATGEIDQVFDLLTRFSHASKNDGSILIARRLRKDAKPLADYSLPSGKSDVFNLSYDIQNSSDVPFETVLMHTPETPERALLWANYYLQKSEVEYLRQLNVYLEAVGSPYEIELGDARDNILLRTSFKPRKNLSLLSDGPLVSVIIAAFNSAETINYALGSILNQTYRHIEILVCDDDSCDDTLDILRQYVADPRVRVFKSNSNQGPYNIRNQMISEAKGEVITFHDADDIALPHRIAIQLRLMMNERSKVSLGMWLRIRENGHIVAFKDGFFLHQCLNSIMFLKTVFEDHGPYRQARCAADSEFYELIRGLLDPGEISYASEPLVIGLWSAQSLTQTEGIEADELGYRSAARRSYSSIASRQRMLGNEIVSDSRITRCLQDAGIYRQPQITIEIRD